jgi:hypothetical protein
METRVKGQKSKRRCRSKKDGNTFCNFMTLGEFALFWLPRFLCSHSVLNAYAQILRKVRDIDSFVFLCL